MLYPAMNDLLKEVNNRYLLVNLIARRARQIALDADETGEVLIGKPVSMAIDEISKGQLHAVCKDE